MATWRACQVPDVRAATVAEPDAVSRACRNLGANLLVIEPVGQSIYSLKQLCAAFRRSGVPRRPEGLEPPASAGPVLGHRAGGRP